MSTYRIEEFEKKMDELLEEFSDMSYEELADSLEYYLNMVLSKRNRE